MTTGLDDHEDGHAAAPPVEAPAETAPDAGDERVDRGRRWWAGIAFPIAVWALWRLVHLAISLRTGGPDLGFTARNAAFYYDGERYLQITKFGYALTQSQMPNTAFFPGVSWLAWPVWRLTGSELWTGHLVANATGLGAFVTVWGASAAWKGDRIARRAVWLLALWPSSLFLWAFYSEGLFMTFAAGAVWADRRNRPVVAAVCLFGLSTTRSVGVAVGLVYVLARVIAARRVDRRSVGYAAAAVAGIVPVLVMMRAYTGNPFAFFGVQADWGRALSPPWVTLGNGVQALWPEPSTIMVPALVARNLDLWSVAIVAVAIGYLAWSRRDRYPVEAWMLGIALIALPLCSTSLASFNRFVLADWVIYPAYASIAGRLPAWARPAFWVVAFVALAVTTYHMVSRFSVDRFVG